jgi:hypothetical protein
LPKHCRETVRSALDIAGNDTGLEGVRHLANCWKAQHVELLVDGLAVVFACSDDGFAEICCICSKRS